MRSTTQMESLGRTSAQVGHVSHAQALGHFRQPGSAGGEESAEQLTRAEFLQPELPALGIAPQAFMEGMSRHRVI